MEQMHYAEMAVEYLHQAEVLDKKIISRRRRKKFRTAEERELNDRAIASLYEMKRDVLAVQRLLTKRAAEAEQEESGA